jgi:hypothetical protein
LGCFASFEHGCANCGCALNLGLSRLAYGFFCFSVGGLGGGFEALRF